MKEAPVEQKIPEYPSITLNGDKTDGIDAYGIDDNITVQFQGKIIGINERYDKKGEFEYRVQPKSCDIVHSGEKTHMVSMMKKGVDKDTYKKFKK